MRSVLSLLLLILVSPGTMANSPQTQGMEITGDQELPQVLYIVPWKTAQPTPISYPSLPSPLEVPVTPCDLGLTSPHWECITPKKQAKR